MSFGKLFVAVVVLGLIVAGVMQYMGYANFTGAVKPAKTGDEKVDPYKQAETDFMAFKYDVAVVEYKKAVDEDPKSDQLSVAMYRIGVCYDSLGKGKELQAEQAYKAFADQFPNDLHTREAQQRVEYLRGITNQ